MERLIKSNLKMNLNKLAHLFLWIYCECYEFEVKERDAQGKLETKSPVTIPRSQGNWCTSDWFGYLSISERPTEMMRYRPSIRLYVHRVTENQPPTLLLRTEQTITSVDRTVNSLLSFFLFFFLFISPILFRRKDVFRRWL